MSKRILVFSGNFSPELTGIGKYSGEMVDWFAENGYHCTVITTFPYYPQWEVQNEYKKSQYWFKKEIRTGKGANPIVVIRCPHYIPTNPTGFKRLLSGFTISFTCFLALIPFLFSKKFDYVLTVAPPFELGLLGVLYKKIRGASFIYHIQDLQIDAAKELGMLRSRIAVYCLSYIERYILNNSDFVSSISEGMIKNIKSKTTKEIDVVYFPNWVNTHQFYPIKDKQGLKARYGINPASKVVLYSGAIGVKQGLDSVIHSAKSFSNAEEVTFVICGSGPYRKHLEDLTQEIGARNVIFLPLQNFSELNAFLNMADVHLVIQKSNASDLMMPSKLCAILAIGGTVVVTANPGSGLHDIITTSNIGIVIKPENVDALTEGIEYALTNDLSQMRVNAEAYASQQFARDVVLSRFERKVMYNRPPRVEKKRIENIHAIR